MFFCKKCVNKESQILTKPIILMKHEYSLLKIDMQKHHIQPPLLIKFKFKLSFIVIPLHVWTYSGTRCRASQDHGAT